MTNQGKATITKTFKDGKRRTKTHNEGDISEIIEIDEIPSETFARVEFAAGVTVNLGDFESARLDVRLSLPCHPRSDSLQETFDYAKEWVWERLDKEVDKVRE